MAVFFLDTSALVKRYDQLEAGAFRVLELCDPAAGHALYLSAVASVELGSALNRKGREGRLSPEQRDGRWTAFRRDLADQYRLVAWDQQVQEIAERLVFAHPIRAYDAVQLASALRAARFLAGLAGEVTFCTADRNQGRAGVSEGLQVELLVL